MVFTSENILLIGSLILFVSIFISSRVSARIGVPMLLLFLILGMFFGSDGIGINFSNVKNAQFIGMFALSVILFSGGLDTRFSEIKPVMWQGITLSTLGVILMALITGLFIWLLTRNGAFSFTGSLALCLLLASTMSSTDSASVFNLLRTQKVGLKHHLRPLLELESGSNDPMAYMLTIALIQFCKFGELSTWSIVLNFILQFVLGLLMGALIGRAAIWVINKIHLNNVALYPVIMLSIVFFTFSITELVKGNGYLAVYITGIIMGNTPFVRKRECMRFMDGITWLCQAVVFLTLGLLVEPHQLIKVALPATLIGLFMIFFARPLTVMITLLPFKKPTFKPKLFASWVGLRGAVPIIFATYPVVAGVEGSDVIFNVVFFITILSLLIQGTTITWIAKLLNVATELPKEGNLFGIELPEEIDSKLWDIIVTEELLTGGNQLKDMNIPQGVLVIMIKRGDAYLVPNGTLELLPDDHLLLISQSDADQEHALQP
jgi:cell volume regulation protein A